MADTSFISQAIEETAADAANARISQETIETAAADANVRISQVTIELGRGPEVVPPAENPVATFTLAAGLGNTWFIVPQLSDSGEEQRDKAVKSMRITGIGANTLFKAYGYGPLENIDVADIEGGTGYKVGPVVIQSCSKSQQSKRYNINMKNAMMHTVRVEGSWDGITDPDRVEEIVYEVARQGVRR